MAYLSPSCDDALFQWASACLPRAQAGLYSLHELADSQALVDMACRFANIPQSQMSSQPDDNAQPWERRTWVASALAAAKPPGVITPEEAHAGGPPAARGLVAAVLLSAVEGPEQQAAVTCIMGLHASHQACLANVLQQLMSMGSGTSGPRSRSPNNRRASQGTDRGSYLVCHSTSNLRTSVGTERLFEGNLSRGASTSVDRRLSSLDDSAPYEARQLHEELEEYTQKVIQVRKAQQRCQQDLSEAKVMMYQEADMCHDLDEDLTERECEHSELMGQMGLLKQELQAESYIAESEDSTLERLHHEIFEQTRQYNDLESRHNKLEEKLLTLQTHGPTKKQSWKRSAALAKISRVKEDITQKADCLRLARAAQARSGQYTQVLRIELAEAEQALMSETAELEEMTERLHIVSDGLHKSEKELDCMSTELKTISNASIDDLRDELDRSKISTEQAEKAHADAVLRTAAIQQRHAAAVARYATSNSELESAEDEAQQLRREIALANRRQNLPDEPTSRSGPSAAARNVEAMERLLEEEERQDREEQEQRRRLQEEEEARAEAEAKAEAEARAEAEAKAKAEAEARAEAEAARERQEREEAEARERALELAAAEAEAAADQARREELEAKLQQERLAQAERAEQLAAEAREARRAKKEALAAEKAEAKVQRKEAREEERAKAVKERAARTAAIQQRHDAAIVAELALSRSELESAEDEAQQLRKEIANARRKKQEAQEEREANAASAREAQAMALAASKAESEVSIQATVLELQIVLREREQAHRESLAGEMEAAHQRELRLLAAALHRLGMRYGRALGQSEAAQEEDAAAAAAGRG